MRYGIISISKGTVNFGNNIIEYATKSLLRLPEPAITVSAFTVPDQDQIDQMNGMDFILVPGSTTLAEGHMQCDASACFDKIRVPIFCVGASIWLPRYQLNTGMAKRLAQPVGTRDPITHKILQSIGIESVLVGCPVMHLRTLDITSPFERYTVIGFARENHEWQDKFFKTIPGKKIAAIQEYSEVSLAKNNSTEQFDYTNIENVMQRYAQCSRVVTGRLHGVLPAISQRKPVFFFGDSNDSRFSLLSDLNVRTNPMGGSTDITYSNPEHYTSKLEEYRARFYEWIGKTIGRFS